jgi:hypothetical protein
VLIYGVGWLLIELAEEFYDLLADLLLVEYHLAVNLKPCDWRVAFLDVTNL